MREKGLYVCDGKEEKRVHTAAPTRFFQILTRLFLVLTRILVFSMRPRTKLVEVLSSG